MEWLAIQSKYLSGTNREAVRYSLLITALIFGTNAVAQPASERPTPSPTVVALNKEPKTSTEQQVADADNQPPIIITIPSVYAPEANATPKDKQKPADSDFTSASLKIEAESASSNRIIAICTGVLAAAALIQIGVYIAQAILMKSGLVVTKEAADAATMAAIAAENSVNQAQTHLEIDERAYVVHTDFTHGNPPAVGQNYATTVVWKNTGRTPSKNGRTVMGMGMFPEGPGPVQWAEVSEFLDKNPSSAIIGSGEVMQSTVGLKLPVSQGDLAKLTDGSMKIYVYGRYVYQDIFNVDKWHTTSICHWFDLTRGKYYTNSLGNSID